MSNIYYFPTLKKAFVKNILGLASLKEIIERLKCYATLHQYKIEETIYVFVRETFLLDLFFQIEEKVRDELLFRALEWASPREKRRKILPKSAKEISQTRSSPYFSSIQQNMMEAIFRKYNMEEMQGKLILNKYIVFFYEMSFFTKVKEV